MKQAPNLTQKNEERVQEATKHEETEQDKKFKAPDVETEAESAIRILLRIRKMTEAERNEPDRRQVCYEWNGDQIIKINQDEVPRYYKFKYIYGEDDSNETVFEPVKDMIIKALDGHCCTIFAYG